MITHCGFVMHLSNNEWCRVFFFHVFVSICMSSLVKCLCRSFAHFFYWVVLFFWYWTSWAGSRFWRLIHFHLFHLLLFSHIHIFALPIVSFVVQKLLSFNYIPFVYFFCLFCFFDFNLFIFDDSYFHLVIMCIFSYW